MREEKKYDDAFLEYTESAEYAREQKNLAKREEKERAEELRLRQEKQRKMDEHK